METQHNIVVSTTNSWDICQHDWYTKQLFQQFKNIYYTNGKTQKPSLWYF